MQRVTTAERRARLVARHHLHTPAGSVEEVAASLVGFHSSDPVSVYLSAWARIEGFEVGDLNEALFERKSLVRMLGMRRTLFVQSPEVAAIMDIACGRDLVPPQRRRLITMIESQGLAADGAAWLAAVEKATLEALGSLGQATASELTALVPELGKKLVFGEGKTWGGEVGMSTRVLFLLATTGRIVRGQPRGTWRSSLYQWALVDDWLENGLPQVDPAWAEGELFRLWLESYGPGTMTDLRWWTGWTMKKTRRVLARLEVVEVGLDDGEGLLLADDKGTEPLEGQSVALLPGLDPSVMGWKERGWFLGDHQQLLFDRNGNAGPTIWVDGRIVGGWTQRLDGEVAVKLLEDVGSEAVATIETEADRLTGWFGDVRIKTRFRAPLERNLTS